MTAHTTSLKNYSTNEYNYGLDALRIFSMFMIIILHTLGQGGILFSTPILSSQYWTAWVLEFAAFVAVNCYGFISGYVGLTSKHYYSRVLLFWFQTFFYTISITLIFHLIMPDKINWHNYLEAFFPISTRQYWYITSYFALLIFAPLLNIALTHISRKHLKLVCWTFFLMFSLLPTLSQTDIFILGNGYTTWWLIVLYVMGAYIRKYGALAKWSSQKCLYGYLGMIFFILFYKFIFQIGSLKLSGHIASGNQFLKYTATPIVIASLFLFLCFQKLHLTKKWQRFVKFCTPLTLSVYLIHAHPLVWDHVLHYRFVAVTKMNFMLEFLSVIAIALFIFVCSILIDIIRLTVFSKLHLKQRLLKCEKRYFDFSK